MSATSTLTPLTISKPGGLTRLDRIFIGLLVICTFALYARTGWFDFVRLDDQDYITDNPHIQSGLSLATLKWAMTSIVLANWHPLTEIVQLTLVSLFGSGARAFHLTNALLHTISVALLYLFLRKSTGRAWPALFTAALWGLHPLREESVAWISEMKDVLCGTFWLLCMLAYLRYSNRRTLGNYSIVLVVLVLALLSKPMAVTLPAVLLLLDFWPLGRNRYLAEVAPKNHASPSVGNAKWWGIRVAEKLPLLALCIADALYATRAQRTGAPSDAFCTPIIRTKNAAIAYVDYLRDTFFPHNLGVLYPHPAMLGHSISTAAAVLCALVLVVITVLVVLRFKTAPYLAVGWFWFLGTLVPVIGVIQVGAQSHADRYTYLPCIGVTMALVWWISDLCANRRSLQIAAATTAALASVALATAVCLTLGRWVNNDALFGDLLQTQPDNYLALCVECDDLVRNGQLDEAYRIAKQAIAAAPRRAEPHASYAFALRTAGRLPEALREFAEALNLDPQNTNFWDGLGSVRDKQANEKALTHDPAEQKLRQLAIGNFQMAINYGPEVAAVHEHLALQYARVSQWHDAITEWEEAVRLKPNYAQAQGDLADALRLNGDLIGAVEHYGAALTDGSKNPDWETNLAWLVATSPQATPADVQPMIAYAKDACDQTKNQQVAPLDAYAACLARVGRIDDAVSTAKQAVAQANAAKDPKLALAMQRRLDRYEKGLTYVAGDDATTKPTTTPQ
jgi:tetratricopeptide (TPR) repeat protein